MCECIWNQFKARNEMSKDTCQYTIKIKPTGSLRHVHRRTYVPVLVLLSAFCAAHGGLWWLGGGRGLGLAHIRSIWAGTS